MLNLYALGLVTHTFNKNNQMVLANENVGNAIDFHRNIKENYTFRPFLLEFRFLKCFLTDLSKAII